MDDFVSLTYVEHADAEPASASPTHLLAGRIVGHKCPSCGRVYVPRQGLLPDVRRRSRSEADEVEVQRHRHRHRLHDRHPGAVLRPAGDRAVRRRVGPARRRRQRRSAARTSSTSRTTRCGSACASKAVWRPEGERTRRRASQPRLGRRRRRHRRLRADRRARRLAREDPGAHVLMAAQPTSPSSATAQTPTVRQAPRDARSQLSCRP